ncbi:YidC/Oxa1 family membrane protein insertase [Candidatus Woesebacteria bacterium]|nr:YidC/Oxa1 family membrane protein insertase [Candidatus Woesebacteria bacterium]
MLNAIGQLFNTLFAQPVLNVLVAVYKLFVALGLPGAFGFSIIAITVAIRVVLYPVFKQQLETTEKMKTIKPKLDKLQKKYKNDQQQLQKAQLELYKTEGINPASGCLAALVQIPLFLALYRTLQLFLQSDAQGKVAQQINEQLYGSFLHIQNIDPYFFGINLAVSPASTGNYFFYIVPVVTAGLQFLQTSITFPQSDDSKKIEEKKKKKEQLSTTEEFQSAMGTQMKYVFPLMIGWFSYSLPLGLSLYWNIFSLFSIAQHYHINGAPSKSLKPSKAPVVETESPEEKNMKKSSQQDAKKSKKRSTSKKRT